MSTEIWRQDNHTLSVPQDGKHQAPCLRNTLATIQKNKTKKFEKLLGKPNGERARRHGERAGRCGPPRRW